MESEWFLPFVIRGCVVIGYTFCTPFSDGEVIIFFIRTPAPSSAIIPLHLNNLNFIRKCFYSSEYLPLHHKHPFIRKPLSPSNVYLLPIAEPLLQFYDYLTNLGTIECCSYFVIKHILFIYSLIILQFNESIMYTN